MNRTFAVRKECMKKSSSCSFGQMTSSVTCGSVVVTTVIKISTRMTAVRILMNMAMRKILKKNLLLGERLEKVQPQGGVPIVRRTLGTLVVFCLLIFEKPWMQGKGLNLVGLI